MRRFFYRHRGLFLLLALTFVLAYLAMMVFQAVKYVLYPGMSIEASHAVTNLLGAYLTTVAVLALYMTRDLNRRLRREIVERETAQESLRHAYDVERHAAEVLRESLIREVPKLPQMDCGIVYQSASSAERVGGDFYDIFPLDDGVVAVLVGDVAGKGIEAAGFTETVRSTVRALAHIYTSPSHVLGRANEVLIDQTLPGQFATAVFLTINTSAREVRYAIAGHPPPMAIKNGTCGFLTAPVGLPLGIFLEDYGESCVRLDGVERIVLYTDGLLETRMGSITVGEQLLIRALSELAAKAPQETAEALLVRASELSGGSLTDDIAIVVIRPSAVDSSS